MPNYFIRLLGLSLLHAAQYRLAVVYNYLFISVMLIDWERIIVEGIFFAADKTPMWLP